MTEDDLRALVRQAVTRHLDRSGGALPAPAGAASVADPGVPAPGVHASFGRYLLPREPGHDDRCLIEPAVKCTHCGYCQSHGF